MSIKEALERQSLPRPTKILERDNEEEEEKYEKFILKMGVAIFKEAGIPGLIAELQEKIGEIYPDAKTENATAYGQRRNKYLLNGNVVEMGIGWNYKKNETFSAYRKKSFNRIYISVEPLTKRLIISGKRDEIIPESVWNSPRGKIILEDALVNAYRNPQLMFWPPAMI